MVQRCNQAPFTGKARHEFRVGLQVRMKDLDSNIALQLGVVGFPDFSHATASQTLAQFIFSKVLPVAVCICTHSSPHTPEKSWFYLHSFPGNRITSKQEGYTTIPILSVEEVPV